MQTKPKKYKGGPETFEPEPFEQLGAGEGQAGVLDLMGAGERGRRITPGLATALEDQAAGLGSNLPLLAVSV